METKIETEFLGYREFQGEIDGEQRSFLVASCDGKITAYGMRDLEKFGRFFVKPGDLVYEGQVLGMSYGLEMVINPTKEKRLTNFRMTGHEEQIKIADPKVFSIEEALGII